MKIIDSVGFEVGHDMRRYGQPLSDNLDKAIADGWRAADYKFGKHHESPDRDVLRWLQLRRNAHKRSVFFDPKVTPYYLGLLGADECPITGAPMTIGTKTETDGSVDRVLNNYGYTVGNLVMMSVRANKAKGSLSPDEIRDRAKQKKTIDGLSAHSWKMMAYIVDVALESLSGNHRQLLTGQPHVAGLSYELQADVQAAITSILAVKPSDGNYLHHPIGNLFTMLYDNSCRPSSKALCAKLTKHVAKSPYIGNGRLMWSYWADKKNIRMFKAYWDTLLDQDKLAIDKFIAAIRSVGNVKNTPTKEMYRSLSRSENDSLLGG